MNARGGYEIGTLQGRMQIFVRPTLAATERTWLYSVGRQRNQGAHVQSDELGRSDADEFRQRPIDSQHSVLFVVNDNKIRNGVKNLCPLAAGLSNPSKKAGVFQGDRGVANQCLQQIKIVRRQFLADVSQGEDSNQISLRTFQAYQSQVFPAKGVGDFLAQGLHATAGNLQVRMLFRKLRQSGAQLALLVTFELEAKEPDAL